jgi:NAD+ kinase
MTQRRAVPEAVPAAGLGAGPGTRTVLVVAHTGRDAAVASARFVVERLAAAGLAVRVLPGEAAELASPAAQIAATPAAAADGAELVVVIGGDGTLLRAAELARPAGLPLLGVNLGHVGFLAEADPEDLVEVVDQVAAGRCPVEERMTIDITVRANGRVIATTWALNEATVEKAARERMVDVVVEVDGRPLSRWGCDGVVFATPTGSTAYAFSAGGPVVWPEVEALLVVPISAHALFARPMVVSPDSELAAEVIGGPPGRLYPARPAGGATPGATPGADGQSDASGAVLWCDGRRRVDLPAGARVEVRRGARPVLLARLGRASREPDGAGPASTGPASTGPAGPDQAGGLFTDRLVAKFGLPVQGWRGQARTRLAPGQREEGRSGDA